MNKKYWLWGAIIGIIISFGAFYYLDNIGDSAFVNIPFFPAIIVSLLLFGLNDGSSGLGPLLVFLVYGFIVGAIIGWLYGKIKNRKNEINV
ncbi:MAG: hypothetical protein NTU76_04290 [Candidatus Taylorbacteria bacterium]|nr:hypothetical protein [Candidatus Taylorbacteria bacterium]